MPPSPTTGCPKFFLAVFLKTEQRNKCCNSRCLVSVMGVAVTLWCSISTGTDLLLPTCCLIRSMMDFFFFSLSSTETNWFSPKQPSSLSWFYTFLLHTSVIFNGTPQKNNTVVIMHGGDRLPAPKSTLLFFTLWAYMHARVNADWRDW